MKKRARHVWVLLIPAALLLCFGKALLRPKEMNTYENRYAYGWKAPTVQTVETGSFQSSVEDALADQVPLAQRMKALYNRVHTGFLQTMMQPVWNAHPDRYFQFCGLQIFGGSYITYPTRTLSDITQALDEKADNLNAAMKAHPELEFFVYYIEKDTDIQFETGQKVGAGDYLLDRLSLEKDHAAIFTVDSFGDFARDFYRTDHHWNCDGSYRGYTQLADLLRLDTALKPTGEKSLVGTFSGAKAAAVGARRVFAEEFYAYRYDFPAMTVTVDGIEADYGNQEAFLDGSQEALDYGAFYGRDNAEVIFDTGKGSGENLLVIGDSFDNAVLKLLAAGCDKTFAVDLRYYAATFKTPFDLGAYTQKNGIDRVLLMGNIDYYTMADFMLEG